MCKMYLFMSIYNETENKRKLNGIRCSIFLKRNLTEPRL
jgi:hypothetical protein